MKKIILIFFIHIKSICALEIVCNFEEVYQNGDSQSGIILIKNDKLRYQYNRDDLYTLIYKNKNILVVDNTYFNVSKIEDTSEKISTLNQIFNDYPDFNMAYEKEDLIIKIEKNSLNFIKRIGIQSPEANLSVNLYDCDFISISDKFFDHFNFIKYK